MQYLTKSFHTKIQNQKFTGDVPKIDVKGCVKKLNKWLANPDQQDVKVDDFNFTMDWSTDTIHYHTKLVIIYHHE